MIHHERLRPPSLDYPADEWNVIEKAFHPEFMAQAETMAALGNGYLGMRGCPEEGGPNVPIRPPGSWHNLRASFRLPSLQALRQDPRHALDRFDLRSRFRRVHCHQHRDGKHRCGPASALGPQDAKGG